MPASPPPAADATAIPTACTVAVVIERQRAPNVWEDWRFAIAEVLVDDGGFGAGARTLRDDGRCCQVLHTGLQVQLHRDEAEGYHLNLQTGAPVWFVMWRSDADDPAGAAPRAWPELVTLSYNEAGRLLDAQERVDNCPLPADVAAWLQAYVDLHYRPEPRQRRRPASFKPPGAR